MYRISAHIIKNSFIMLRRSQPIELRIASFSRSPASGAWYKKHRERDICPPPKPKPLPPLKVPYYLIGTGLLLVFTAGFMVYAKQKDEIRDWLSINAPWFDDMIAVAYEENVKLQEGVMEYVVYFKDIIVDYLEGPPDECLPKLPPPVQVSDNAAVDATCDDEDEEDENDEDDEGEDEEVCVMAEAPIVTKDVCKVEECLKEAAEETNNTYISLRDYCVYYNKLVLGTLFKYNAERYEAMNAIMEEKKKFIKEYEEKAQTVLKRFNDLAAYIDCGVLAPKDRLAVSKQMAQDFKDTIKRTQIEYKLLHQKSVSLEAQWKRVKCLLDAYIFESASMFPELNYSAERPRINGDIDLLIIHAKKYVDSLQEESSAVSDNLSGKITRAFASIPCPRGKEKEQQTKLQNAVKQAKTDMEKEYADKTKQMCQDFDDDLKRKLRERQASFEEKLKERLAAKEEEAKAKGEQMIRNKVEAEKRRLQALLDAMESQLSKVEQKMDERLTAERESKRARLLHMASNSLLEATKRGEPRVSVEKELEILRKASSDDELVTTILNALPDEINSKGVVPESVIKERYHSMEDIAMSVALVEAEGAPLPLYAFSWLQSRFLFMKPATIPQAELDNPPKEPFQDLDTFDLLMRARYFMHNGNLANAVRYVNALEGASRGAADDWYQSANALLQTRLAAEAIMAHATAIALQYI